MVFRFSIIMTPSSMSEKKVLGALSFGSSFCSRGMMSEYITDSVLKMLLWKISACCFLVLF